MKVSKQQPSETKVTLTITASEEDVVKAKNNALKKMAPSVKLQGFRPGHAPLDLVEKNVDRSQLAQETVNEVLNDVYPRALEQEKVRPVAQPKIELSKFVPFTSVEFNVEVEVVGKITLPKYSGLGLKQDDVNVTAKDVEEVLSRLQKQMAEYTEVDTPAKNDDRVWIDFEGFDEKGKEVKGAKGSDYPLSLGSNTFIPGFEEKLVGIKAGETKEFILTFPKDYGVKALQNKKVTFKVTAKKVENSKLPKLDADFAKKVGNFTSLDELKEDIKKQVKIEREQQSLRAFQDSIIKKIISEAKVSLPESMLTEQEEIVSREFKQNLMYRGQTFEEYLEAAGLTEEEYKEQELKPAAEERLKAGLVLSEIAEQEKLTVTPEELEIRIQVLKGQYKSDEKMQENLEKPEARRDVAARLLTEKTINKLVDLNK